MSIFSMVGDVLGSLHDMKELGKIQDAIEDGVKGLIDSGKCPEALKSAYEGVKSLDKDAPLDKSMSTLKDFAKALTEHVDDLPDDLKKKAGKFGKVVEDLQDKAADIQKLTGK